MQDFLGLDNRARVNEPSTLGKNWRWRVRSECINSWLANLILGAATIYFRTPPTAKAPVFEEDDK
jgi:4-alpha-glucanotransferase